MVAGLITLNQPEKLDTVRVTFKRTRRGKIRKLVRPVYFREDIACGVKGCTECADKDIFTQEPTIDINFPILIVDSDTVIQQTDFLLTDPCVRNCVLSYSALDAVKTINRAKCDKLRALCSNALMVDEESRGFYAFPNEFLQATFVPFASDDVTARLGASTLSVAKWYASHLSISSDRVVLLTSSDVARDAARAQGVTALTVWEYAESQRAEFPLAGESLTIVTDTSEPIYPPHLSSAVLQEGLLSGAFRQGILRMSVGTCMRGSVGEVEIVGKMALNRAIDGDLVVYENTVDSVLSTPEEDEEEEDEETPETVLAEKLLNEQQSVNQGGRIVGILKRQSKEIAGTLRFEVGDDEGDCREDRMFIPADPRIPFIRIKTRNASDLIGKRIVAVIDSWERSSKSPNGHWVAILGVAGDRDTESSVILREHQVITRPFSLEVLACLPSEDFVPSVEEIAKRVDMRNVPICSIDPPGCKDIDDALSCQELPNGNFSVGVHIADVSYFVHPGSAIDLEAAERCTTVYLVEKRTDMLPGLLTANLCSLREKVDRLTFSVIWEMTPEGVIVGTEFVKGVICSQAALTYQAAQERIENSADKSLLTESIRNLNRLAKKIRAARMDRGALELASQEVRFELDAESGDPTEVSVYQSRDTNKLVEEFMVLANQSVARKILSAFPSTSVLRRHPPPKEEALELLKNLLEKQGFEDFKFGTNKELAESLAKVVRQKDPFFNRLVRVMTTRCMNQAQYFCTGDIDPGSFWHYGLAMDLYTHFTSPIRRYADLLVHRELAAAIGLSALPVGLQSRPAIHAQCDVMNMKHKLAQCAGRASAELHIHLFFKKLGPQECDTVVTKIRFTKRQQIALHVLSPKFSVEGVVTLGAGWSLDVHTERAVNLETNETITVFDHVKVRVEADTKNFRFRTVFTFLEISTEFEKPANPQLRKKIEQEMFPDRMDLECQK